jgi:hypothetical membrane protein
MLAPTAGLAGIAFAIGFTPSFAWAGSALSDLGAPSAPTPWLFNGKLVLGGLFALPFAWWRWRQGANPIERVGAIGLAGTGLALSGVGLFPTGTALHLALAGRVPRGLVRIWVGVVHFSGWLLWAISGVGDLAVPETFGALLLSAWLVSSAFEGC